jgi:hypothetical protein
MEQTVARPSGEPASVEPAAAAEGAPAPASEEPAKVA